MTPVRDRRRATPAPDPELQPVAEHDAQITVHRVNYDGAENFAEERITMPRLPEHVSRVRVNTGTTEPQGGYAFLRCDVSVEMPCVPEASEMGYAIEAAGRIARDRLMDEMALLRETVHAAAPPQGDPYQIAHQPGAGYNGMHYMPPDPTAFAPVAPQPQQPHPDMVYPPQPQPAPPANPFTPPAGAQVQG